MAIALYAGRNISLHESWCGKSIVQVGILPFYESWCGFIIVQVGIFFLHESGCGNSTAARNIAFHELKCGYRFV